MREKYRIPEGVTA